MINKQVHITSVIKAIETAKRTGSLDMSIIQLFKLVSYYVDFTEDNKDYLEENRQLKIILGKLKYKYPNVLCNYKTLIGDNQLSIAPNIVPTIADNTIYITDNVSYSFVMNDFLKDYFDANGDSYSTVRISVNPTSGKLYYGGNTISTSSLLINNFIELPLTSNLKLHYERTDMNNMSDTLLFRVSDNNINPLYSIEHTLTIIGTEVHENQPATVGDITIYPANRAVTVITLPMLTSLLAPPYNDPEGDLIDAIRLDEISTANQGKYYINGVEAVEGDIISRLDVIAGLFTHVGADVDTVSSDVFSFSARDEGSLQWIQ